MYARSAVEAVERVPRAQRGHHPASVMVWWGVSYDRVANINFYPKKVDVSAKFGAQILILCITNYGPFNIESLIRALHASMQSRTFPFPTRVYCDR